MICRLLSSIFMPESFVLADNQLISAFSYKIVTLHLIWLPVHLHRFSLTTIIAGLSPPYFLPSIPLPFVLTCLPQSTLSYQRDEIIQSPVLEFSLHAGMTSFPPFSDRSELFFRFLLLIVEFSIDYRTES